MHTPRFLRFLCFLLGLLSCCFTVLSESTEPPLPSPDSSARSMIQISKPGEICKPHKESPKFINCYTCDNSTDLESCLKVQCVVTCGPSSNPKYERAGCTINRNRPSTNPPVYTQSCSYYPTSSPPKYNEWFEESLVVNGLKIKIQRFLCKGECCNKDTKTAETAPSAPDNNRSPNAVPVFHTVIAFYFLVIGTKLLSQ